jgi:hypothetical protein
MTQPNTLIQLKRGTAAALTNTNPTLAAGEPCLETDTGKIKYGNGTVSWNDLPYAYTTLTAVNGGEVAPTITAGVPLTIPSLALWLQADDDATVHINASGVSQFSDKSNTAHHAVQAKTKYRPKYSATINDLNVLSFNAGQTALTGAVDITDDFTLFVVFRQTATSENARIFALNRDTNLDTHYSGVIPCAINAAGDEVGVFVGGTHVAGQSIATGQTVVYAVKREGTTVTTSINGGEPVTATVATAALLNYFAIGAARHNYEVGGFSGEIAEAVLYARALNSNENTEIVSYLNRWIADPYWSQVQLRANFDADFTDLSTAEFTFVNSGSVAIDTAIKKFGAASAAFNSTNFLSVDATSMPQFGVNGVPYTLELWAYVPSSYSAGVRVLMARSNGTTSWSNGLQCNLYLYNTELHYEFALDNAGSTANLVASNFPTDTWTYIAVSYDGTTTRLFVDGEQAQQATDAYISVDAPTILTFGVQNDDFYFVGNIDDIRLTIGPDGGRYTENFTPPLTALPVSGPIVPVGMYEELTGFWPMNEANSIRYDLSPAGHDLYLSGDAGYGSDVPSVAGVISNAAQFGDGSDFLRRTGTDFFTSAMTLSFWVKVSDTATATDFVENWSTNQSSGQVSVGLNSSGKIEVKLRTTSAVYTLETSETISNDTWYYVCARYNNTANVLSLRVNTTLDSVSTAGSLAATTNSFNVGAGELGASPPAQVFVIDSLATWNKALADAEVDSLYNYGDGRETLNANW